MASLSLPLAPPPSPAWQDQLHDSLVKRNAAESAYATIINEYGKLARTTKALKDRNQALLNASRSVKSDSRGGVGGVSEGGAEGNPVLKAYADSLEGQIASLRNELSDVYKSQGQNTQKLLTLTETIQEKENQLRIDQEEIRRLAEGESKWKRMTEEWQIRMQLKDDTIQQINDENQTLTLELTHVLERNEKFKQDNANLQQRWLDKMNEEVDEMNRTSGFVDVASKDAGPSGESDAKSPKTKKQDFFRLKATGTNAGR